MFIHKCGWKLNVKISLLQHVKAFMSGEAESYDDIQISCKLICQKVILSAEVKPGLLCYRSRVVRTGERAMRYPFYSILRAGREYSKQWPAKAELNSLFIENKVILLTSIMGRVLPLLAFVCAVVQYRYLGASYLPQILTMLLFLATLPLQGFYWLGVRAATPLPPSIASWYQQIRQKMQQQGIALLPVKQPGCYKDLALLLQQAYQQLDRAFVKQWL